MVILVTVASTGHAMQTCNTSVAPQNFREIKKSIFYVCSSIYLAPVVPSELIWLIGSFSPAYCHLV